MNTKEIITRLSLFKPKVINSNDQDDDYYYYNEKDSKIETPKGTSKTEDIQIPNSKEDVSSTHQLMTGYKNSPILAYNGAINGVDCIEYSQHLNRQIDLLFKKGEKILKIKDPKKQKERFEIFIKTLKSFKVVALSNEFSNPQPIKHWDIFQTDEQKFGIPRGYSSIKDCYDLYIDIPKRLQKTIESLASYGGYIIENNKLVGPFDSKNLLKNRIKTKLNKEQLGLFMKLLIQTKIFDHQNHMQIADMISNHVISKTGINFSRDSIKNQIKKMDYDVSTIAAIEQVIKDLSYEITLIKNKSKKK